MQQNQQKLYLWSIKFGQLNDQNLYPLILLWTVTPCDPLIRNNASGQHYIFHIGVKQGTMSSLKKQNKKQPQTLRNKRQIKWIIWVTALVRDVVL